MSRRIATPLTAFAVALSSWACVGGGGGIDGLPPGYDPFAGSLERPNATHGGGANTNEPPGSSLDAPSSTGGGGSPTTGTGGPAACNGEYRCSANIAGQERSANVRLVERDGRCFAVDTDDDDEQSAVEGFSSTGSGATFSIEGIPVVCQRT